MLNISSTFWGFLLSSTTPTMKKTSTFNNFQKVIRGTHTIEKYEPKKKDSNTIWKVIVWIIAILLFGVAGYLYIDKYAFNQPITPSATVQDVATMSGEILSGITLSGNALTGDIN